MKTLKNYPIIKKELASTILAYIEDKYINNDNIESWHQIVFNTDYYIIGYFEAENWLKNVGLNAFEAIEIVRDYELENFGEFTTKVDSEKIVNMIAYIFGEELLYSENFKNVKQLKRAMKEILPE